MLTLGIIVTFNVMLIALISFLERLHPNRIRRNPIA